MIHRTALITYARLWDGCARFFLLGKFSRTRRIIDGGPSNVLAFDFRRCMRNEINLLLLDWVFLVPAFLFLDVLQNFSLNKINNLHKVYRINNRMLISLYLWIRERSHEILEFLRWSLAIGSWFTRRHLNTGWERFRQEDLVIVRILVRRHRRRAIREFINGRGRLRRCTLLRVIIHRRLGRRIRFIERWMMSPGRRSAGSILLDSIDGSAVHLGYGGRLILVRDGRASRIIRTIARSMAVGIIAVDLIILLGHSSLGFHVRRRRWASAVNVRRLHRLAVIVRRCAMLLAIKLGFLMESCGFFGNIGRRRAAISDRRTRMSRYVLRYGLIGDRLVRGAAGFR